MRNYLPLYFEHLREAQKAAEAVDDFDLNSDDPESLEEFDRLTQLQTAAGWKLIDYCFFYAGHIKSQLKDLEK